MTRPQTRRSGGRSARREARNSALAEDQRAIHPGMSGGHYKPLSQQDIERIHEAALRALEEIGLNDAPESGVAYMCEAGAILGDDGRVRFPRKVVEEALEMTCKKVTLYGRDPKHDLELYGNRVHFGTAGAAVSMVDAHGRNYRDSSLQDLHDASKICEQLDNIHFVQRPIVARDITNNLEMDLNSIYAACSGTKKNVGTSFSEPGNVDDALKLLHMIAGGEEAWRARPFVVNSNCFVVPPMKFATESCEAMEKCVLGGMPVLLLSAGMSGATAPSTIAGAVVQAVAECLAGLVYVNAIVPGHPVIFGTWPFGLDLRTGAMTSGSGEQALLSAACSQMHEFYGVPGGSPSGMTDSKLPDMQAGWEQMCSNVMNALAGTNMIYEAAGMHSSLLGFCHESLILGNDLIGQAMRCLRGVEVDDATLAVDQIREVCVGGPGHYLGTQETLSRMQKDFVYPEFGSRTSPKEWEEIGKPDLIQMATARKEEILSKPTQAAFSPEIDAEIRGTFKIYLPKP